MPKPNQAMRMFAVTTILLLGYIVGDEIGEALNENSRPPDSQLSFERAKSEGLVEGATELAGLIIGGGIGYLVTRERPRRER